MGVLGNGAIRLAGLLGAADLGAGTGRKASLLPDAAMDTNMPAVSGMAGSSSVTRLKLIKAAEKDLLIMVKP